MLLEYNNKGIRKAYQFLSIRYLHYWVIVLSLTKNKR